MMKNKGKSRVIDPLPSEESPLLGESSTFQRQVGPDSEILQRPNRPRKIRSLICTLSIIIFSLLLSSILFLSLLAYSFKPSPSELSTLPTRAFQYAPPSKIEVVDVNEQGILLNLTLDCGIDYDLALGVGGWEDEESRAKDIENGFRGVGANWWEELRRWLAQKAFDKLPEKAVAVTIPREILIYSTGRSKSLISLRLTGPLNIPLIPNVSSRKQDRWLRSISFTAFARPVASTGELLAFAQKAWLEGNVKVEVVVDKVQVELPTGDTGISEGSQTWWSQYTKGEKEDLSMMIEMPVPHLPGLPSPGRSIDLASLVKLRSYSIKSIPTPRSDTTSKLSIEASATLPNFLRGYNITLPFSLPFLISLPGGEDGSFETEMAHVVTDPVVIGQGKEIELRIEGRVIADLDGLDGDHEEDDDQGTEGNLDSSSPLSHFFQNYLNGLPNPITVVGLSAIPPSLRPPSSPESDPHSAPKWLLDSLPSLNVSLIFPAPPHQNLIQAITIEHMRISEANGKMRASGVVVAQVLIPPEMGGVDVDIVGVKPDVLIYNGPVQDLEESNIPSSSPISLYRVSEDEDDYPARAFGHINPTFYLPSTTLPTISDPSDPPSSDPPTSGKRLTVRAPITNLPLDVLPGRDPILRDFVSKIVFKGGALAGIDGEAAVKVKVGGLSGKVGLSGLPVRGEVWVGRGRFMGLEDVDGIDGGDSGKAWAGMDGGDGWF